ncbi:hypothetical protein [Endozoicomonas montiporae]|nr:hypothetical protein [Endozoicomonas montiporae]AMO58073.1 hypothetical protein EZMO1_4148 [Endozoicomonas montiporae CL-33]
MQSLTHAQSGGEETGRRRQKRTGRLCVLLLCSLPALLQANMNSYCNFYGNDVICWMSNAEVGSGKKLTSSEATQVTFSPRERRFNAYLKNPQTPETTALAIALSDQNELIFVPTKPGTLYLKFHDAVKNWVSEPVDACQKVSKAVLVCTGEADVKPIVITTNHLISSFRFLLKSVAEHDHSTVDRQDKSGDAYLPGILVESRIQRKVIQMDDSQSLQVLAGFFFQEGSLKTPYPSFLLKKMNSDLSVHYTGHHVSQPDHQVTLYMLPSVKVEQGACSSPSSCQEFEKALNDVKLIIMYENKVTPDRFVEIAQRYKVPPLKLLEELTVFRDEGIYYVLFKEQSTQLVLSSSELVYGPESGPDNLDSDSESGPDNLDSDSESGPDNLDSDSESEPNNELNEYNNNFLLMMVMTGKLKEPEWANAVHLGMSISKEVFELWKKSMNEWDLGADS